MNQSVEIAKGSIETVAVDISDRFQNLTTLDDASSKIFDINPYGKAAHSDNLVTGSFDNEGMVALPIIDGTLTALTEGQYWLFIQFVADTDHPRLGPINLTIK